MTIRPNLSEVLRRLDALSAQIAALREEPQDMTTEEAARALGYSPQRLRLLAMQGQIPGRKVCGRWRFDREEIRRLRG